MTGPRDPDRDPGSPGSAEHHGLRPVTDADVYAAGRAQMQIIAYAQAVIDHPEADPQTVERINRIIAASATGDLDTTLAAVGEWIRKHEPGSPPQTMPVAEPIAMIASIAALSEMASIVASLLLHAKGTSRIV